jgi:hypothetical protein
MFGKKKKKLKVTKMHQKNAEQGKYGDKFKHINKAREDREKLLKLLQEQ